MQVVLAFTDAWEGLPGLCSQNVVTVPNRLVPKNTEASPTG